LGVDIQVLIGLSLEEIGNREEISVAQAGFGSLE
jgi:hypothetical protein